MVVRHCRWALVSHVAFLLVGLLPAMLVGEESAGKEVSQHGLKLIFDEDNKTFPQERFQSTRSGESEWSQGKHWILKQGFQVVRPLRAGTTAEFTAKLEFPPLAKDGDAAETRIGFVFADRQIGSVAFVRKRDSGKTTSEIRFLREAGGAAPLAITARTLEQQGDLPSGAWQVFVRCGAVCVEHDAKEVGCGCLETHFAPILGVVLAQESGQVITMGLVLKANDFPAESPSEKKELLTKASALNEEGKSLYREKKFAEAAEKTKAALELYRKVHAQPHGDLANSLSNVATVLRNTEQPAEAIPFYEEAIQVRTKLFGEDHPDVALLHMELTSLLVGRQRLEEAFRHCLAAHFSFIRYYGSEYPAAIATQQMLDKLPRPKDKDET